jgi:hypothetical protein
MVSRHQKFSKTIPKYVNPGFWIRSDSGWIRRSGFEGIRNGVETLKGLESLI